MDTNDDTSSLGALKLAAQYWQREHGKVKAERDSARIVEREAIELRDEAEAKLAEVTREREKLRSERDSLRAECYSYRVSLEEAFLAAGGKGGEPMSSAAEKVRELKVQLEERNTELGRVRRVRNELAHERDALKARLFQELRMPRDEPAPEEPEQAPACKADWWSSPRPLVTPETLRKEFESTAERTRERDQPLAALELLAIIKKHTTELLGKRSESIERLLVLRLLGLKDLALEEVRTRDGLSTTWRFIMSPNRGEAGS